MTMLASAHSGAASPVRLAFHCTDGAEAAASEEAWEVLSPSEHDRAVRFHFEHDRQRWVRGRAWVRQQLGAALNQAPARVNLVAAPGGRLFVPNAPLDFNLSHTGPWIALGLCTEGRVGIDLESINPTFPALKVARAFFLPEEEAWIAAGPIDRFFHLWTAKEALMKATGRGMSLEPDKIRVSLREGLPSTVTQLETGETWPVQTQLGPADTVLAVVHLPRGR